MFLLNIIALTLPWLPGSLAPSSEAGTWTAGEAASSAAVRTQARREASAKTTVREVVVDVGHNLHHSVGLARAGLPHHLPVLQPLVCP